MDSRNGMCGVEHSVGAEAALAPADGGRGDGGEEEGGDGVMMDE